MKDIDAATARRLPPYEEYVKTQQQGDGLGILRPFGIAVGVLFVLGGMKIAETLQSYGLAMTASVIAMIPSMYRRVLLAHFPFGIWTLIVLLNADVKRRSDREPLEGPIDDRRRVAHPARARASGPRPVVPGRSVRP